MNDQPRTLPRWTQTFLPGKQIAITPILISINVLVWLIMIATGVSPYAPSTDDMLRWGATETQAVIHGDYWRLLTSNYLHYGFIHLGVNMLSLNNIGRGLEQFIGKWRFLVLYVVTGIFASTVSIWWHADAVGVGASGAICGLVGVLLALLTTKLIEKTIRMKMLRSLGISLGLLVVIGFSAGIDNAAHFGGIVAGMVGGYLIFPEIKSFYYEQKVKYMGLVGAALIILGGAGVLVTRAANHPARTVAQIIDDFSASEAQIDPEMQNGKWNNCKSINSNVIPIYEKGLRQIDTIIAMDLNDAAEKQMERTRTYMHLRINYFRTYCKSLESNDQGLSDSAAYWKIKGDSALQAINKP